LDFLTYLGQNRDYHQKLTGKLNFLKTVHKDLDSTSAAEVDVRQETICGQKECMGILFFQKHLQNKKFTVFCG